MKYIKKLGRFGVLFLALIFTASNMPLPSLAATSSVTVTTQVPDGARVIETQNAYKNIQLWHYSGGYWGINANNPFRINDSEITGNLETLADAMDTVTAFTFSKDIIRRMCDNDLKFLLNKKG